MSITIIHVPEGLSLSHPWQAGWGAPPLHCLPSLAPRGVVARAGVSAAIPAGAHVYAPPVVTDAHRAAARRPR